MNSGSPNFVKVYFVILVLLDGKCFDQCIRFVPARG